MAENVFNVFMDRHRPVEELTALDREKAEMAKRFVVAMVRGEESDELTREAERWGRRDGR